MRASDGRMNQQVQPPWYLAWRFGWSATRRGHRCNRRGGRDGRGRSRRSRRGGRRHGRREPGRSGPRQHGGGSLVHLQPLHVCECRRGVERTTVDRRSEVARLLPACTTPALAQIRDWDWECRSQALLLLPHQSPVWTAVCNSVAPFGSFSFGVLAPADGTLRHVHAPGVYGDNAHGSWHGWHDGAQVRSLLSSSPWRRDRGR